MNNISNARRAYARSIGERFTQEDAAKYLSVSSTTYRNYEQGRTLANTDTLKKLADLYGVSVDYLIGNDDGNKIATDDEAELLKLYRRCDAMGKKAIMASAHGISYDFIRL